MRPERLTSEVMVRGPAVRSPTKVVQHQRCGDQAVKVTFEEPN
jgi:hypothetical protein